MTGKKKEFKRWRDAQLQEWGEHIDLSLVKGNRMNSESHHYDRMAIRFESLVSCAKRLVGMGVQGPQE